MGWVKYVLDYYFHPRPIDIYWHKYFCLLLLLGQLVQFDVSRGVKSIATPTGKHPQTKVGEREKEGTRRDLNKMKI